MYNIYSLKHPGDHTQFVRYVVATEIGLFIGFLINIWSITVVWKYTRVLGKGYHHKIKQESFYFVPQRRSHQISMETVHNYSSQATSQDANIRLGDIYQNRESYYASDNLY